MRVNTQISLKPFIQEIPDNGCVVIVALNGEYTVKRLRRGVDCVWLEPANPRYQPIRVSISEELLRNS